MSEDHQPIAAAAKAISAIMPSIARLRYDVANNRARLTELVNAVNALLIPRGWIGIDDDGMMHVTYLAREDDLPRFTRDSSGPATLAHHADFVWEYSAMNRQVRCVKCRDGSFADGEVRACDGPVQPSPTLG